MFAALIPALGPVISQLIDKLFTTDEEKAAAAAKIMAAEQAGQLDTMKAQLSAILTEGQSQDPWTSRARPMFLYVMYLIIILCFGGGITGIWWPDYVDTAAVNITNLLAAIPEEMWWLFGTGYLGYTGSRSIEKIKKVSR